MIHIKVKFKNEIYWRNDDCISPLDHFSEDGELLVDAFVDICYAYIFGNDIKRFGQIIGQVSELEEIK